MTKFVIDLWMDGYDSDEDHAEACRVFLSEALDSTATSVTIISEIKENENDDI